MCRSQRRSVPEGVDNIVYSDLCKRSCSQTIALVIHIRSHIQPDLLKRVHHYVATNGIHMTMQHCVAVRTLSPLNCLANISKENPVSQNVNFIHPTKLLQHSHVMTGSCPFTSSHPPLSVIVSSTTAAYTSESSYEMKLFVPVSHRVQKI